MPDLKISQLPPASTPLAGTELVAIVQGGVTEQTTVQALLTGTVPSGTANGVLYLNGSKVVTSGSGLTFDGTNLGVGAAPTGFGKLDVRNGTNFRVLVNGIAGYGSNAIAGINDAGSETHLGLAGTPIAFYVQAAEQMRLTSTGLGIGTNNPGAKLHVVGSTYRQNSVTGSFGFTINTTSATTTLATLFGGSSFAIQTAASGTNQLLLDASGNLGLGVTPSAWGSSFKALQVNGGASLMGDAANAYLNGNAYYNGTNWIYTTTNGASRQVLSTSGIEWYISTGVPSAGSPISFTQAMTLDASGNLLVGATSALLAASGRGNITLNGTGSTIVSFGISGVNSGYIYSDANLLEINAVGSRSINFTTNNTERARIPAAGGMVVGTAALATTATDGFLYVPTCAGTPTGTPTTQTGTAPIVVDTTNNKLYFYSGGQWRDAGP
jgi:hypothetical protein